MANDERGRTKEEKEIAKEDELATEPLKPGEHKEVTELSAVRAAVVHRAVLLEGEDELERTTAALAWSGIAAGLSMGFSLVTEALLHSSIPDRPWRTLIVKFGYSVGFLIVVMGRQQLFTENTLTVVLPFLARKNRETFFNVARLWGTVLVANVLGAFVFAFVIAKTELFKPHVVAALGSIASESLQATVAVTFLRGIFAGWLIALMVWLLPAADTAKVPIIIVLTYVVGLGGFSHVVAGSVEVFYLVATNAATWSDFFVRFFVPTLLGNIVGGVTLVAALGHAQVAQKEN